jgi:hypothetical protein
MQKYKVSGTCVRGASHIESNLPCQDRVSSSFKNNVITLSLADGAGSCSMSEIGAEISTQFISDYLCLYFDEVFLENPERIKEVLLLKIRQLLIDKSKDLNVSLRELSSTLLFVSVKNGNYLAGHIGDGLIASYVNSKPEVFSLPENGEYSNQTYFTTSKTALDHFRIYKGELGLINGFVLMSDGSYESLFDKNKNSLTMANETFFSWLKDEGNSQEKIEEALHLNLKKLFTKKTTDDCSVNLLLINHVDEVSWYELLLNKVRHIFN